VHVWTTLRVGSTAQVGIVTGTTTTTAGATEQLFVLPLHKDPEAQTLFPQKHVLLFT